MSYERMKKREAELRAEVAGMLGAAEAADAQEDETFGKDKRGDELPDWARDKQKRLAKIQQAKASLEAEAKLAAEEERRIEAERERQSQAEGRKKPGKPAAPPSDEPDAKSQRNFTDPESRIMKSKDGFVQAYNAQAAVDAGAQIIVAHELTQSGSDQGQLAPLITAMQIASDGATWLDRQIVAEDRSEIRDSGFGREVNKAISRRARRLVEMGLATAKDGKALVPVDTVATLERREVERVGHQMATERGLAYMPANAGEYVSGRLVGVANLVSGRFAMIDNGLGFQLVPWLPTLERHIGRHISGLQREDGGIEWSLGRQRGLAL